MSHDTSEGYLVEHAGNVETPSYAVSYRVPAAISASVDTAARETRGIACRASVVVSDAASLTLAVKFQNRRNSSDSWRDAIGDDGNTAELTGISADGTYPVPTFLLDRESRAVITVGAGSCTLGIPCEDC